MASTHGPIDPAYRYKMEKLASVIDEFFNGSRPGHERTVGFALLTFPFGLTHDNKDRINYISNTDRKDMIMAMKEFIARAEGRHAEEQPGGGAGHG